MNAMEDQKAIEKMSPSGRSPGGRQKELEELKQQRDEYLAGWQRAKADLSNYKKEEKERMKEVLQYATEVLVLQLIPILDSLERAEREVSLGEKETQVFKGFLQIGEQIRKFLKEQDVKEIQALGKKFNPEFHEAVGEVEGEESGCVAEVVERGYTLNGKLIRPTKVKVIK